MHLVAMTVHDKCFLSLDGMPWHGPVGESNPVWLLHDSYDFHWLMDGDAEKVRGDYYAVASRNWTR